MSSTNNDHIETSDYYKNSYMVLCADTSSFSVSPNDGLYQSKVLGNFEAGGNTYPSVRSVYYKYSFQQHNFYIVTGALYWCRGVGIIKKIDYPEFSNRKVYEVVRYKIAQ